jgi:hypothetical protein
MRPQYIILMRTRGLRKEELQIAFGTFLRPKLTTETRFHFVWYIARIRIGRYRVAKPTRRENVYEIVLNRKVLATITGILRRLHLRHAWRRGTGIQLA